MSALAVITASVPLLAADDIRVAPLARNGVVLVSFELADGFTEDTRAAIYSGLQTTFSYTVELRAKVPIWIDRTFASATISTTVQYDNLTRRHTVLRRLDGRAEEPRVTEDDAVVRQLLMTFHQLPLVAVSKLEPNRDYYIRVRASMRPRTASFLWPWASGPSGEAKFTFIP